MSDPYHFEVIVIGAGHAGVEAALAAARMGRRTALLTANCDTVGQMSCNPAIGGVAKGQIVREVDALGGAMGRLADGSAIQYRLLNRGKGPAMQGPRAQCDKKRYQALAKRMVEAQEGLTLRQEMIEGLVVEGGRVSGVRCRGEALYRARCVVVTTGTFLQALMHTGEAKTQGGRAGDVSAEGLSGGLRSLGLELRRFKTGTPPRLNGRTIDFERLQVQPGDDRPVPFSFLTERVDASRQMVCHITHTNANVHDLIRANLHRAPMYSGQIASTGPRYCPSIEDKVVRFAERDQHQIFLEPEGRETLEYYCNGISTSLPRDVQERVIAAIVGLERAEIMRFGYAVEYDYAPPTQLGPTLETLDVPGLFLAGQINGTTGYEEAAAQGLVAGDERRALLPRGTALGARSFVVVHRRAGRRPRDERCGRTLPNVYQPGRIPPAVASRQRRPPLDRARARALGLVDDERWERFTKHRDAVERLRERFCERPDARENPC